MGLKAPKYPFGPATTLVLTSADATQALEIFNSKTVIDGKTNAAGSGVNRTINLTIGNNVEVGDRILLIVKTPATETTTLGTGFSAPVITGVAGETLTREYVYSSVTGTFVLSSGQLD
jgi:hypothetical protein